MNPTDNIWRIMQDDPETRNDIPQLLRGGRGGQQYVEQRQPLLAPAPAPPPPVQPFQAQRKLAPPSPIPLQYAPVPPQPRPGAYSPVRDHREPSLPGSGKIPLPPLNLDRPLEQEENVRAVQQLLGLAPDLVARVRALEKRASAAEQATQAAEGRNAELSHLLSKSEVALGAMRGRMEAAERAVTDTRSQVAQLHSARDQMQRRHDEEAKFKDEQLDNVRSAERERVAAVSEEVLALQRDIESARSESDRQNQNAMLHIQRLEAKLGAEEGFVNKLRDVEQENVSSTAQALSQLSAQLLDLQNLVATNAQRLATETSHRKADAQELVAGLKRQEHQAVEREHSLQRQFTQGLDDRSGALSRKIQEVMEDLEGSVAALRTETSHRMKQMLKKDEEEKRAMVRRMMGIEHTLREESDTRAQAVTACLQKIEAAALKWDKDLHQERAVREEKEKKLRNQVQLALLKLRRFARDLEEKTDRSHQSLQEVVRMEIKSRFTAIEKVQEQLNAATLRARADLHQEMEKLSSKARSQDHEFRRQLDDMHLSLRKVEAAAQDEYDDLLVRQVLEDECAAVDAAEDVQRLRDQVEEESVAAEVLRADVNEKLRQETDARKQGDLQALDQMESLLQGVEGVDSALEGMRGELHALAAEQKSGEQHLRADMTASAERLGGQLLKLEKDLAAAGGNAEDLKYEMEQMKHGLEQTLQTAVAALDDKIVEGEIASTLSEEVMRSDLESGLAEFKLEVTTSLGDGQVRAAQEAAKLESWVKAAVQEERHARSEENARAREQGLKDMAHVEELTRGAVAAAEEENRAARERGQAEARELKRSMDEAVARVEERLQGQSGGLQEALKEEHRLWTEALQATADEAAASLGSVRSSLLGALAALQADHSDSCAAQAMADEVAAADTEERFLELRGELRGLMQLLKDSTAELDQALKLSKDDLQGKMEMTKHALSSLMDGIVESLEQEVSERQTSVQEVEGHLASRIDEVRDETKAAVAEELAQRESALDGVLRKLDDDLERERRAREAEVEAATMIQNVNMEQAVGEVTYQLGAETKTRSKEIKDVNEEVRGLSRQLDEAITDQRLGEEIFRSEMDELVDHHHQQALAGIDSARQEAARALEREGEERSRTQANLQQNLQAELSKAVEDTRETFSKVETEMTDLRDNLQKAVEETKDHLEFQIGEEASARKVMIDNERAARNAKLMAVISSVLDARKASAGGLEALEAKIDDGLRDVQSNVDQGLQEVRQGMDAGLAQLQGSLADAAADTRLAEMQLQADLEDKIQQEGRGRMEDVARLKAAVEQSAEDAFNSEAALRADMERENAAAQALVRTLEAATDAELAQLKEDLARDLNDMQAGLEAEQADRCDAVAAVRAQVEDVEGQLRAGQAAAGQEASSALDAVAAALRERVDDAVAEQRLGEEVLRAELDEQVEQSATDLHRALEGQAAAQAAALRDAAQGLEARLDGVHHTLAEKVDAQGKQLRAEAEDAGRRAASEAQQQADREAVARAALRSDLQEAVKVEVENEAAARRVGLGAVQAAVKQVHDDALPQLQGALEAATQRQQQATEAVRGEVRGLGAELSQEIAERRREGHDLGRQLDHLQRDLDSATADTLLQQEVLGATVDDNKRQLEAELQSLGDGLVSALEREAEQRTSSVEAADARLSQQVQYVREDLKMGLASEAAGRETAVHTMREALHDGLTKEQAAREQAVAELQQHASSGLEAAVEAVKGDLEQEKGVRAQQIDEVTAKVEKVGAAVEDMAADAVRAEETLRAELEDTVRQSVQAEAAQREQLGAQMQQALDEGLEEEAQARELSLKEVQEHVNKEVLEVTQGLTTQAQALQATTQLFEENNQELKDHMRELVAEEAEERSRVLGQAVSDQKLAEEEIRTEMEEAIAQSVEAERNARVSKYSELQSQMQHGLEEEALSRKNAVAGVQHTVHSIQDEMLPAIDERIAAEGRQRVRAVQQQNEAIALRERATDDRLAAMDASIQAKHDGTLAAVQGLGEELMGALESEADERSKAVDALEARVNQEAGALREEASEGLAKAAGEREAGEHALREALAEGLGREQQAREAGISELQKSSDQGVRAAVEEVRGDLERERGERADSVAAVQGRVAALEQSLGDAVADQRVAEEAMRAELDDALKEAVQAEAAARGKAVAELQQQVGTGLAEEAHQREMGLGELKAHIDQEVLEVAHGLTTTSQAVAATSALFEENNQELNQKMEQLVADEAAARQQDMTSLGGELNLERDERIRGSEELKQELANGFAEVKAAEEELRGQIAEELQREREDRAAEAQELRLNLDSALHLEQGEREDLKKQLMSSLVESKLSEEELRGNLEADLRQKLEEGGKERADLAQALRDVQERQVPELQEGLAAEARARGQALKDVNEDMRAWLEEEDAARQDAIQAASGALREEMGAVKEEGVRLVEGLKDELVGVTTEMMASVEHDSEEKDHKLEQLELLITELGTEVEAKQKQAQEASAAALEEQMKSVVTSNELQSAVSDQEEKRQVLERKLKTVESRVGDAESRLGEEEAKVTRLEKSIAVEAETREHGLRQMDGRIQESGGAYQVAIEKLQHELVAQKQEDRAALTSVKDEIVSRLPKPES